MDHDKHVYRVPTAGDLRDLHGLCSAACRNFLKQISHNMATVGRWNEQSALKQAVGQALVQWPGAHNKPVISQSYPHLHPASTTKQEQASVCTPEGGKGSLSRRNANNNNNTDAKALVSTPPPSHGHNTSTSTEDSTIQTDDSASQLRDKLRRLELKVLESSRRNQQQQHQPGNGGEFQQQCLLHLVPRG